MSSLGLWGRCFLVIFVLANSLPLWAGVFGETLSSQQSLVCKTTVAIGSCEVNQIIDNQQLGVLVSQTVQATAPTEERWYYINWQQYDQWGEPSKIKKDSVFFSSSNISGTLRGDWAKVPIYSDGLAPLARAMDLCEERVRLRKSTLVTETDSCVQGFTEIVESLAKKDLIDGDGSVKKALLKLRQQFPQVLGKASQ